MSGRRCITLFTILAIAAVAVVQHAGIPARADLYVPASDSGVGTPSSTAPPGGVSYTPSSTPAGYRQVLPGLGRNYAPRILVISTGVQRLVFPPDDAAGVINGDVTDTHGYGTLATSVILELLANAQITSRFVTSNSPTIGANLTSLGNALTYAANASSSYDAVLLALSPSAFLDPLAFIGSYAAYSDVGSQLAMLDEALLQNPGPADPPVAGIPVGTTASHATEDTLRAQMFAKANLKQKDVVESFVTRVRLWQTIDEQLSRLGAAGVPVIAPAGDVALKDAQGKPRQVYPQSIWGIAARQDVITVGAAYRTAGGYRVGEASGTGPTLGIRPKPDLLAPGDLLGLLPSTSTLTSAWPHEAAGTIDWAAQAAADVACSSGVVCVLQTSTIVAAAVVAANAATLVAQGIPHTASNRAATDDEAIRSLLQAAASGLQARIACQTWDTACTGDRQARPWEQGAGVLLGLAQVDPAAVPVPLGRADLGEINFGAGASLSLPLWSGGASASAAQASLTSFIGQDPNGSIQTAAFNDPAASATLGSGSVTVSLSSASMQGGLYQGTLNLTAGSLTSRASITSAGSQALGASTAPAISADGRYVAFTSGASNLVTGDYNEATDVFVRDRRTGTTTRVSVTSAGDEAERGASSAPSMSPDGCYIAFTSDATNLVSGDTNGVSDVFLRDTCTGGLGTQTCSASTVRISVAGSNEADRASREPFVSADGRYVAFTSDATNLVNDTNDVLDVFLRDTCKGAPAGCVPRTSRISARCGGAFESTAPSYSPSISADGRFVAFVSEDLWITLCGDGSGDSRVPNVYQWDAIPQTITLVSQTATGAQSSGSYSPSISADGRFIAFASGDGTILPNDPITGLPLDTNSTSDVFVRDMAVFGVVTRESLSSAGAQADAASTSPAISSDGGMVAFASAATNLVPDDANTVADIFVHDRGSGSTTRVSISSAGLGVNGSSAHAAVSSTARYVAFESDATDLVSGDTNTATDVFVRDRITSYGYPMSVLRDLAPTFHVDYAYIEGNTDYLDRREGERAEDVTIALLPALPARNAILGRGFKMLQEMGVSPQERVIRHAVTKGGSAIAAQTNSEIGTAVMNGVPPGYWRYYLVSDYSVNGEQTRTSGPTDVRGVFGEGLGAALSGSGPEIANVPGAKFVVSSIPGCNYTLSGAQPLTDPCLDNNPNLQTLPKDPATGFCKFSSPTQSYWLYCGEAAMAVPTAVTSRAVRQLEYNAQNSLASDWKACSIAIPDDVVQTLTALAQTAAGPSCQQGEVFNGWDFRERAPDCLGPAEKAANPLGMAGDIHATYSAIATPTASGSRKPLFATGVLTSTLTLPKPNLYSVITFNFSYRLDNAFIALWIQAGGETVGDSAGRLVIAGSFPGASIDPLIKTVSTTTGSTSADWTIISNGADKITLTAFLIPTGWGGWQNNFSNPSAVALCAPAIRISTFAKQGWGNAGPEAGVADPIQKFTQSGGTIANEIVPGKSRMRSRYVCIADANNNCTGNYRFEDLGQEPEDLKCAIEIPKNTTIDPTCTKLHYVGNECPNWRGGPAFFKDLRRTNGTSLNGLDQPLSAFAAYDPRLTAWAIGDCDPREPAQNDPDYETKHLKALFCQRWQNAQNRFELTNSWVNGRFYGFLPVGNDVLLPPPPPQLDRSANGSVTWVAQDGDDGGAFECSWVVTNAATCSNGTWNPAPSYAKKFPITTYYDGFDGLNGSQAILGGYLRVGQSQQGDQTVLTVGVTIPGAGDHNMSIPLD